MDKTRSPFGPVIILLLALMAGGWFLQRGVAQEQNLYVQSRLLEEVVDHISNRFVDPVDRSRLYQSAIEGVIQGLGDPNSSLLDGAAYENFRIQTEGDYGGVGLEIVDRDDYITVVGPLPGSPGTRAGIRAGDEIIAVDGQSTRGWSAQEAVQVLRGRPGTDTEVRIRRPGMDEPIDFTLTRERVQLRSVPFMALLEDDVGYLPLGVFSETSTRELEAAADSLRAAGARSFILDLRGNPGGVLDQSIRIVDLFLERGATVAETRGQARNQTQTFRTASGSRFGSAPVVILVDRGSASASEIVSGALQDHDRAVVVGTPTFGKGSVQTLFSLSGGNVLKLTTARWYTPRGRSIETPLESPESPAHAAAAPDEEEAADEAAPEAADEAAEPLSPPPATNGARLALTVDGQFIQIPDTTGRPQVTSYGGRTLLGGGGIVPDLIVLPDTLDLSEQDAVRRLFRHAGGVNTAIFNQAVEFLQRNEVDPGNFDLPASEMDRLAERLREAGVELDEEAFRGVYRFLSRELAGEIASQAGGERARFLSRVEGDLPLQRALELLREAGSLEDLFVLAGRPFPMGPVGMAPGVSDGGPPSPVDPS
ncbi:MAG: S41 family peptidase [Gemmatimonadales bacterium]|nr:MAG: S41 family peptidase [Gemmatimonadales bacterium]